MKHSALPMTIEAEVQKFEQLYQENLDRIYRFVYSHVRNREAADERYHDREPLASDTILTGKKWAVNGNVLLF